MHSNIHLSPELQNRRREVLDRLAVFHRPDFRFEEGPHKYYLGETELTSVTTYLHGFIKPFDAPYWSQQKAKERGVKPTLVLEEWKAIADRACYLGTEVHKWIEDFFNGHKGAVEDLDPEVQERIQSFMVLHQSRLHKLIPIAQELRMFNKKMRLAGTLDALFMDERGNVYILDWKTNKKLVTDQDKNYSKMLMEFSGEWDNNMNHYSIQTSIYRLMLKDEGVDAQGCFIVHVPPTGECRVLPCKDYRPQLITHFGLEPADYGFAI